ncbi:hypothetical protein P389DRAFT_174479 [Cystobasidium minutum MCA 4210]|uniref:uncharacterized protein n=1 Tax=Cystobasidium minutum MCA 4210 TaxID=1397322 RepID=UPI0034CDD611|eukprot:jgi/Rhomi1/174479/fgenesh1_kg.8_\
MTDIRIRPVTPDDVEECAICWGNRRDTYPSIYPLRLVNPTVTQEERLARNVKDLKKMFHDPRNVVHVALLPTGSSEVNKVVAGYSIWARPEGLQRDEATSSHADGERDPCSQSADENLDPECDHELARQIGEESKRVKEKIAGGKRLWLLQQLFVRDNYQRRGVGTALIEYGLKMIEEAENSQASEGQSTQTQGYKIGLTSSPQGQKLYNRYGFMDVYWFNPKFDDVDEQGEWIKRDVRWPLMIKE